jgi:flagellin
MAEVSLSTAVRDSLLSLGDATKLIDQTQSRLSTGLRVAKATDDPVAFFQARALSDRADDFTEKKEGIDQGISTLETGLNGIEAVEAIVRQIKGIATNLKGATGEQFTSLIAQFNVLRLNIGTLTDDAVFNGINVITATAQTLDISFSAATAGTLSIDAINISETGLSLGQAVSASDTSFNFTSTDFQLSTGFTAATTISVTYQGTGIEITGGGATAAGPTITFGTVSIGLGIGTISGDLTLSQGDVITVTTINTVGGTAFAAATGGFFGLYTDTQAVATQTFFQTSVSVAGNEDNFLAVGNTSQVDTAIVQLDAALAELRSSAQTLGSNVALLQTRLDFTENYTADLNGGAAKLTLADINNEGANLLALQTRQQLSISALAFAGQAEQGILSLFR